MSDTTIADGIDIDGKISGDDTVVVEGSVKGEIDTSADVLVDRDGIVEADIHSGEIEVTGRVNGNIDGNDRVELTEDANMIGDITAPRISIADGANFKGHIDMNLEE